MMRARRLNSRILTDINNKRYYTLSAYAHNENQQKLYPSHIPISTLQKSLLTVASAITALIDPTRQETIPSDMVAALGETTSMLPPFALVSLRDKMLKDKTGRRILRDKPVINSSTVDIVALRRLPDGSFGREYVRFLDDQKVSPDTRVKVHFIDDEELAYVMQRFRECHDFFHTLTNLPTTVEAELALKWFEMMQTGLPVATISSFFGHFSLTHEERKRLFEKYVPWALQCGLQSKLLLNVYFEECWDMKLDHLRKDLGILAIK